MRPAATRPRSRSPLSFEWTRRWMKLHLRHARRSWNQVASTYPLHGSAAGRMASSDWPSRSFGRFESGSPQPERDYWSGQRFGAYRHRSLSRGPPIGHACPTSSRGRRSAVLDLERAVFDVEEARQTLAEVIQHGRGLGVRRHDDVRRQDFIPDVIVQAWRSWQSTTFGASRMCDRTRSMSRPFGVASSRTSTASRRRLIVLGRIRMPIAADAIASTV